MTPVAYMRGLEIAYAEDLLEELPDRESLEHLTPLYSVPLCGEPEEANLLLGAKGNR